MEVIDRANALHVTESNARLIVLSSFFFHTALLIAGGRFVTVCFLRCVLYCIEMVVSMVKINSLD